jgi:hypothetical protein
MVKPKMVTFCAVVMRTIAKPPWPATIAGGAFITAFQCETASSWMLSFPDGTVTCSRYVPVQTLMRSPGAAAFTADWIVG